MRSILELIPIALFFIAYKLDGETVQLLGYSYQFDGIFSATAVLMIATVLQVFATWLITREVEKKLWWLLAAVLVLGSATLILRNELFIQWKPTIFNWVLGCVFLGMLVFSEKSLLERMLGSQLQLPAKAWLNLNQLWVANFFIVGALNLYVAYGFPEATWVSYKLYSSIGFTLLLMVLTMAIVFPHIKEQEENT
ncbi:MAG: septation protein IspZ [Pseudomonadales bacterium]|nr:septation protein IspZ [Gammaproteobacteria bacterium]NNL56508.1 septation protein IspZ [Pseudomonadales bacterium]